MKKIIALVLFCSFVLFGCTYQPEVPVEPPVQEDAVAPASDTSLLCMVYTGTEDDAKKIASYYNIGANCLEVHKRGDAVIEDAKKGGRTSEIGTSAYPMYYSVTTRPADELNFIDAYANQEGTITVNYLKDTDQIAVLSFMNYLDGPVIDGGASEEAVTAFALANLPADFARENYKTVYEGDEILGCQLTFIRQIAGYDTVESINFLVSPEGNLMEMRLQNYGQMKDADVEYALVSRDKLEADVIAQIKGAYQEAEKVGIDTITIDSVTLGRDLNGEAYYNITAKITYLSATSAPTQLLLIYYPSRLS